MPGKSPVTDTGSVPLTTGRLSRSMRIAALPAGMALRTLTARLRILSGHNADSVQAAARRANAQALRTTLGDLKGGALKAGQLLSTVDSLFPTDPDATWEEALTGLQESNTALDFAEVEPTLVTQIGPDWRRVLHDLDPHPIAAASLGQVHRATYQGSPVAVKIQYPGVANAIESDMAVLSWALRAGSVVARGLTVPPVVSELTTRLRDELDYEREAAHQNLFAEAFEPDPTIVIPRALLSRPKVLVTEWLDADPLVAAARSSSAQDRSTIAARYQRFLLSAPTRARLLHADPHPGNFRVLADGRLGVLDFGAVVPMPDGMPSSFGRLIRVMLATHSNEVLAGLTTEGFIRPGASVDARRLSSFLSPFSEPARCESFTYTPEWLRSKFTGGADDPRNPDYAVALKLTIPAEHLLTHRVWLGCVGVLCRLRCTIEVAPELRRWLPGFAL